MDRRDRPLVDEARQKRLVFVGELAGRPRGRLVDETVWKRLCAF
jgi:hypothetical protein